ncbi:hypothetical protein BJV82DRAFT_664276 [Fennellomyces sp. T-0311]|nr:hypothetical protein BJV82DRAFT_664276 [Fennellomyces sp. T-0311]
MDQVKLHQTLPGGSITKKKKSKQLSNEEKAMLASLRMWEDKVHILMQAKKYMEKARLDLLPLGEEQELEKLVVYWRSLCQDVASALLEHYLGGDSYQFSMNVSSWGYDTTEDDGYERDMSSNEMDPDKSDHANDEEETDDITRMLSHLRIDPELIHYSPEKGFYD